MSTPARTALHVLLAYATLATAMPLAVHASEGFTPRPQREFTDKPRIEDYSDYGAFLVDIMEYRRQKEERARQLAEEAAARAAAGESVAVLSPLARDPYTIRQPESLEEALERARYIQHPVYEEMLRYDRTTSQSFPLEPMEGGDLSVAELPGMLADPGSGQLAIYEEQAASLKADSDTGDAESSDDKPRSTKAAADTFSVSSANLEEPGSVWARDADGQRYYLQIGEKTNRTARVTYGSGDYTMNFLYVNMEVEIIER